ncbi:P-loop containing nucleoside triphosphate hydrolase protein [Crucibulum laeve]|uniref:P-loop containing nucleoside triphosphate hydrolase protein n=1 Tax=Crucibulum laeve TaxID=68775 RepID=A0A5C3MEC8_9AGAR|nr:P-loop containing nucleoside triphosphate hydrolase protein [Crucibulum laeve]
MTAVGKRKELTADDLLRIQEEPRRKRLKISRRQDLEELGSDTQSTSQNSEDEEESQESGVEDSKGSVNEDSEGGDDDNEVEENGSDEEDSSNLPTATFEVEDRFGRSRFKSGPTTMRQDSLKTTPLPSSFSTLGISATLESALASMSIKTPTEVQAACVPPLLAGRDCIGNAKTGSGKTIAFALPILQKLSEDPYGIYALVLTPTRELAFQISEQFAVLGSSLNIRTAVIVGGMDMMAQALELGNRPHVVIATPGRIVDHLRSTAGEWDLSRVKFLVLDEADRLLTPTFAPELAHLFGVLPKERQTCLFTATLTPSINALADARPRPGKQKPFVHRMKESVETVSTLKQYYILVPSHVRETYLYHLLCNPPESTIHLRRAAPEPVKGSRKPKPKSRSKKNEDDSEPEQPPPTIIFCARPRTAAYLTLLLKSLSIRSTALHSRLTQRERLSSLSLFRASVVPVLISTDVGARGLDIEEVAMVINWDMPNEPEEYTHRVGRTARAGRGGMAVSFVTERDEERVLKIEERIKTKLEEMVLPEEKVLEKLNAVSTAKRLASMELHDSNFGKREEIHQIKKAKLRRSEEVEG